MSYIDAFYDKKSNTVHVLEKLNGKKIFKEYVPEYTLYYEDDNGTYKSLFSTYCKKFTTNEIARYTAKKNELASKNITTYEAHVSPVARCLENNYKNKPAPVIDVAFFDIEVDFDPEKGFSSVEESFAPITAVSVYMTHMKQLICLAVPPKTLTKEEATEMVSDIENTFIMDDEAELLTVFLDLIDQADMLCGFNSEKYDIPYIVGRIEKVLGREHLKKLCLWGQTPYKKMIKQFNKEFLTYTLTGKVHLDYFLLFKKHAGQEFHSYKLDYIGEVVTGENKVPYTGTLDALYNHDFKKFVEYNRQDTMLLVKIDDKKKYIELHNQTAHANCVTIQATMGSVALIEQSIMNMAHEMGLVVPSKAARVEIDETIDVDLDDEDEDIGVAGAMVLTPRAGLWNFVGCTDVNSLYPSAIRTFNMGLETMVAQIKHTLTTPYLTDLIKREKMKPSEAWGTIFMALEVDEIINKTDKILTLEVTGEPDQEFKAIDLYNWIFAEDSNLCISANGTIFKTNKKSIIATVLEKWYAERVEMRELSANYGELANGIELSDELIDLLK